MKDWKYFYNRTKSFKFAAGSAAAALLTLCLLANRLIRGEPLRRHAGKGPDNPGGVRSALGPELLAPEAGERRRLTAPSHGERPS